MDENECSPEGNAVRSLLGTRQDVISIFLKQLSAWSRVRDVSNLCASVNCDHDRHSQISRSASLYRGQLRRYGLAMRAKRSQMDTYRHDPGFLACLHGRLGGQRFSPDVTVQLPGHVGQHSVGRSELRLI